MFLSPIKVSSRWSITGSLPIIPLPRTHPCPDLNPWACSGPGKPHNDEAPRTQVPHRTEQTRHRFWLTYTQVLLRPSQNTLFPIASIGSPGMSVQSGEKDWNWPGPWQRWEKPYPGKVPPGSGWDDRWLSEGSEWPAWSRSHMWCPRGVTAQRTLVGWGEAEIEWEYLIPILLFSK